MQKAMSILKKKKIIDELLVRNVELNKILSLINFDFFTAQGKQATEKSEDKKV